MTDASTTVRVEPMMDPAPAGPLLGPDPRREADLGLGEQLVVRPAAAPPGRLGPDAAAPEPLIRVEEKAARIEDKLSRFESNNQRVVDRLELASARMSEVAQQAELAIVKAEVAFIARRIKNLPGLSALVASSLVTAALAAVLTLVLVRYLPGGLAR